MGKPPSSSPNYREHQDHTLTTRTYKKKENFENKENSKLWNRKKKEDRILNIKDISPQNKVYTKLRNLKKGSHTIQKCFNPQTRNPRAKRLQVDRMERE